MRKFIFIIVAQQGKTDLSRDSTSIVIQKGYSVIKLIIEILILVIGLSLNHKDIPGKCYTSLEF